MVGTVIHKVRRLDRVAWFSVGAAVGACAALLWPGPRWAAGLALAGFLAAMGSWIADRISGRDTVPASALGALLIVHTVLLITAVVLYRMFLAPLNDSALKIPRFTSLAGDPNGVFSIGLPKDWSAEPIASVDQSGLRLRPAGPNAYMGVLEAVVLVRPLKSAPASIKDFLIKTAAAVTPARPRSGRLFTFRAEPGQLISGGPAVWTELEARRFWVPVRQVTLLGVKNKRYLCSVSATGLKSHSTLARVLSLGLFETIRFEPASGKKP